MKKNKIGKELYSWAKILFPLNRSLTGGGVRDTLSFFKKKIPKLSLKKIRSGTKVFDWKIPKEWKIDEAYIEDQEKRRIVDFNKNNLHVMGYSAPINKFISFSELDSHLYSLPAQPKAIPYRTSYYKKNWGFCLAHKKRKLLDKKKKYKVVIKSKFFNGRLNYGELLLKGKSKKEILLSCNICHPSLASNELSGPIVTAAIARWLEALKKKYSYRILFIPETIGSIAYLSKNYKKMKKLTIAGFVITCVGDNKKYSYLSSRSGSTLADEAAKLAFKRNNIKFKKYSYLSRGSDERQYCSPGIDLPVCSIMRSKYGTYPEYHTSLDNLSFISSEGLQGSFNLIKKIIEIIEMGTILKKYKCNNFQKNKKNLKNIKKNKKLLISTKLCEPFMSKYNLRSTIGGGKLNHDSKLFSDLLAFSDGKKNLHELSRIIKTDYLNTCKISKKLIKLKLLKTAKL
tara:strand:- start:8787 stop:10154 length:1368 start_codon:yes stop_codon:yes gene_type:complete